MAQARNAMLTRADVDAGVCIRIVASGMALITVPP
jgi:hypothetical protein